METLRAQLAELFSLHDDRATEEEITERIYSGATLKGSNMCILVLAIFIASIGLNMNSTAVVIGAMLISPLMGAILAIGYGMAVYNIGYVRDSAKTLLIQVVFSLLASAIYFYLSPIHTPSAELIARTEPTTWDVLIATFGGLAGIIGLTRAERGNVIPGVAIATALMPPLCTVGYGIATLKVNYIFGAFYLFLINSFFITIASFLVTKFLGFESVAIDEVHKRRNPRIIAAVLLVMLVPSIISAIGTIRDNNFAINAERFVQNNKTIGSCYIFDHQVNLSGRHQTLDLYLAGEALDYTAKLILLKNAQSYGLHSDQIIFHEEAAVQHFNKNEVIRDLNSHYLNTIQELNQRITELEVELAKYKGAEKAAEKAASVGDTVKHQP